MTQPLGGLIKIKPMTAVNFRDCPDLSGKYLLSEKIDGIRALYYEGGLWSRSGKLLPNCKLCELHQELQFLYNEVGGPIDGELFIKNFQTTQTHVMTQDYPIGDLKFYAFDCVIPEAAHVRFMKLSFAHSSRLFKYVKLLPQTVVNVNRKIDIASFPLPQPFVAEEPEGYMLKHFYKTYKNGRATSKDMKLIKVKFMEDMEALVIGINQYMQNDNPSETDELGYLKKSSHKANQSPMPWMGSLTVQGLNGPFKGVEFNVGSGFSQKDREMIWAKRDEILYNFQAKIQYQLIGSDEKPRIPTFKGFRIKE